MKKHMFLGMIGVLSALALVLSGCKQPTESIPSSSFGDDETISGQLYSSTIPGTYTKITDTSADGKVSSDIGNSGDITKGKFAISITAPPSVTVLENLNSDFSMAYAGYYDNLTIEPADGQYKFLKLTTASGTKTVSREKISVTTAPSTKTETVSYIYVDKKVTIKGTGKTSSSIIPGYSVKVENVNITLNKGWNTLYEKKELKVSGSTFSLSRNNPDNVYWVLK